MVNLVRARRERTRRLRAIPRQSSDFFGFDGGLNLLDSPMTVKPGELSGGMNYEVDIQGGYRRIGGYESYDGSPSISDTSYWKMAYGAIERQVVDRSLSDGLFGATSSATSAYLSATEAGGYGKNHIENSEAFNNADWSIDQITATDTVSIIDGDIAATSEYPTLAKITEDNISLYGVHGFRMVAAESVAIGDVVYVSWYFKPGTREGSGILLEGGGWGALEPGLTVITDTSSGPLQGADNWGKSDLGRRVTALSNGVFKCELWTQMNGSVASDLILSFRLTNIVGNETIVGAAKYLWAGGFQMTIMSAGGPHNLIQGHDFSTWSNTASTMIVADNDQVPFHTVGFVQTLFDEGGTKLTDKAAPGGGDSTHTIRSTFAPTGRASPVRVKKGDKVYVEWYSSYTSGQHTIQVCQHAADFMSSLFGNKSPFLYVNINNGTIRSDGVGSAIESYSITSVATTPKQIYLISFTTVEAVIDGAFGWEIGHAVDLAGATDRNYPNANLFSHWAGFRCVSLPASYSMSPGDGHHVELSYVKNLTGKNNYINTGALIFSGLAGDFVVGENVLVNSLKVMESRGDEIENGESDTTLDAEYTALAASIATAAAAPTGSGPIRGVWEYNGIGYCFRDDVGGTAGQLFKATGSGWSLVVLNERLSFDAGTGTEPAIGDTVTGGTSTANAPIRRVVTTSGTWGVDAAGYLILGTVALGPFQNNESLTFATADGVNAVQTLNPGGRYEFRNNNFYGASDFYRMYGVSGVGFAFEYDDDPTTGFYCEIETGMVVDEPNHLAVHNFHLFLSFPGGSTQLSADGDPVNWTVILGASEIAVGADCTGFNEEVGNSLFIFTRNRTFVLQGNTRANFDLDDFNVNAGAHEWSLERIGLGCYLDDRGFTTLLQTQRTGSVNFEENAISTLIQPLIADLIGSTSVVAAHLIKNRNIYRCYFADGRVVSIAFREHKVAGHMTLEYPFTANCAVSGEDPNGEEIVLIGGSDGVVYQLETGTSFNGAPLRSFLRGVLYHSKTPGMFKKYSHARLDAQLFGALSLKGQIEYDFHLDELNLADELNFTTDEAGGYWDDFTWDEFTWDSRTSGIPQQKLEGEGVNAAVYLHSEATTDPVHILRGLSLQWMPRRDDRRDL